MHASRQPYTHCALRFQISRRSALVAEAETASNRAKMLAMRLAATAPLLPPGVDLAPMDAARARAILRPAGVLPRAAWDVRATQAVGGAPPSDGLEAVEEKRRFVARFPSHLSRDGDAGDSPIFPSMIDAQAADGVTADASSLSTLDPVPGQRRAPGAPYGKFWPEDTGAETDGRGNEEVLEWSADVPPAPKRSGSRSSRYTPSADGGTTPEEAGRKT
jgi:hypothetical protein